jgi:predicted DNA-binding WGR domain protein
MVLKLYKADGGGILHYWEAWDEQMGITVHWGIVGNEGTTTKLSFSPDDNAAEIIRREAAAVRERGYQEIADEELKQIVIEYHILEMGTTEDLERRYRVENLMNDRLGWTGLGHCDGGDIGSGTMNVFCFVVDSDKGTARIVEELKSHDLLAGARLILLSEEGGQLLFPLESLKYTQ